MDTLQKRAKIEKYQIQFNKIIASSPKNLVKDDTKYNKLVEIVQFLRDHSDAIKDDLSKNLGKLIFLVGATGAGKSTLVNYLKFGDDAFIVSNDKGEIQLKNPQLSISTIGTGGKSTTFIPQVLKITGMDGSFVDAPGEGDTTGMLAEIMNSIMMTKITAKVKAIKIILVAKQSSLDSGGGYGTVFKEALDKNIQFFNSINKFKNSIGIVVTCTSVKAKKLDIAKKDLHNILNHTGFQHKDLIKFLLDKSKIINNIQAFSKASESLEMGKQYSSKFDQHNSIKKMIQDLPFNNVPSKNYFNISSSPSSRETMSKVLDVIKMKGGQILHKAIIELCPLTIYALEIKPCLKYLSDLIQGYKSDLMRYVAILKFNNYFKLESLDNEKIKKMDVDIKFISNYVNNSSNQNYYYDWSKIAKVKDKFFVMHKDLKEIDESPGHNFMKFVEKPNITTKPAHESSYQIKKMIDQLKISYKKKDELEKAKNDQTSEYYDDKTVQIFSHYRDETYTDRMPYTANGIIATKEYTEWEPCRVMRYFLFFPYFEDSIHLVTKTRDIYGQYIAYKYVTQTRQIPVYDDKQTHEFNSKKYDQAMKIKNDNLISQKKEILNKISTISIDENVMSQAKRLDKIISECGFKYQSALKIIFRQLGLAKCKKNFIQASLELKKKIKLILEDYISFINLIAPLHLSIEDGIGNLLSKKKHVEKKVSLILMNCIINKILKELTINEDKCSNIVEQWSKSELGHYCYKEDTLRLGVPEIKDIRGIDNHFDNLNIMAIQDSVLKMFDDHFVEV